MNKRFGKSQNYQMSKRDQNLIKNFILSANESNKNFQTTINQIHDSVKTLITKTILTDCLKRYSNTKNFFNLALYGDSVLLQEIVRILTESFPVFSNSHITKMKSSIVSNFSLSIVFDLLKFNSIFGNISFIEEIKSKGDIVEALIGELHKKEYQVGSSFKNLIFFVYFVGCEFFFSMKFLKFQNGLFKRNNMVNPVFSKELNWGGYSNSEIVKTNDLVSVENRLDDCMGNDKQEYVVKVDKSKIESKKSTIQLSPNRKNQAILKRTRGDFDSRPKNSISFVLTKNYLETKDNFYYYLSKLIENIVFNHNSIKLSKLMDILELYYVKTGDRNPFLYRLNSNKNLVCKKNGPGVYVSLRNDYFVLNSKNELDCLIEKLNGCILNLILVLVKESKFIGINEVITKLNELKLKTNKIYLLKYFRNNSDLFQIEDDVFNKNQILVSLTDLGDDYYKKKEIIVCCEGKKRVFFVNKFKNEVVFETRKLLKENVSFNHVSLKNVVRIIKNNVDSSINESTVVDIIKKEGKLFKVKSMVSLVNFPRIKGGIGDENEVVNLIKDVVKSKICFFVNNLLDCLKKMGMKISKSNLVFILKKYQNFFQIILSKKGEEVRLRKFNVDFVRKILKLHSKIEISKLFYMIQDKFNIKFDNIRELQNDLLNYEGKLFNFWRETKFSNGLFVYLRKSLKNFDEFEIKQILKETGPINIDILRGILIEKQKDISLNDLAECLKLEYFQNHFKFEETIELVEKKVKENNIRTEYLRFDTNLFQKKVKNTVGESNNSVSSRLKTVRTFMDDKKIAPTSFRTNPKKLKVLNSKDLIEEDEGEYEDFFVGRKQKQTEQQITEIYQKKPVTPKMKEQLRNLFEKGKNYLVSRKYVDAVNTFDFIEEKANGTMTKLYYLRGIALFHIRKYDRCIEDCSVLIKKFPHLWSGYYRKSYCFYRKKRYDEAFYLAEKADQLANNGVEADGKRKCKILLEKLKKIQSRNRL